MLRPFVEAVPAVMTVEAMRGPEPAASPRASLAWFACAVVLAMSCCWIALRPFDRVLAIALVAQIVAAGIAASLGGARLLTARRSRRGRVFGWFAVAIGLGAIGCAVWMLPITFASTWAV